MRVLTLRMMLMRSASAEVDANAQQLPQYCGMCWLRVTERYAVPLTLRLQVIHTENMQKRMSFGCTGCAMVELPGWQPPAAAQTPSVHNAGWDASCPQCHACYKCIQSLELLSGSRGSGWIRMRSCGSHDSIHAQLPVVAHQSQAAGRSCSDFSS
jgi:hypothetical protein